MFFFSEEFKAFQSSNASEIANFELQFEDDSCQFYCCAFYAKGFSRIRDMVFAREENSWTSCRNNTREEETASSSHPKDLFLKSLWNCAKWEPSGGKSGLTFYKTQNGRFILKELSKFEIQSWPNFAEHYFDYMTKSLAEDQNQETPFLPSLLAKIYGVFKIGFKNSKTNSNMKIDFLVMENLFYGRDIKESYDLKGSMRNRMVEITPAPMSCSNPIRHDEVSAAAEGEEEKEEEEAIRSSTTTTTRLTQQDHVSNRGRSNLVLLDENLLKVSCERPLYVSHQSKQVSCL